MSEAESDEFEIDLMRSAPSTTASCSIMSAFRSVATGLLRPSTFASPRATPTLRTLANPNSLRLLQQRRQLSDEARKKIDDVRSQLPDSVRWRPDGDVDLPSAADLIHYICSRFGMLRPN